MSESNVKVIKPDWTPIKIEINLSIESEKELTDFIEDLDYLMTKLDFSSKLFPVLEELKEKL